MTTTCVDVEVDLHRTVSLAIMQGGREPFVKRVDAALLEYAGQLGLACVPRVRVGTGSDRAIIIRAGGATLPYPPSFLARLWFGIAPPWLRAVADGYLTDRGFPDEWLIACSQRVFDSEDECGCSALGELAAQLVLEVIALRPSALLSPDEAAVIMKTQGEHRTVDATQARDILTNLLDLGVALPDPEWIRRNVRELRQARRSREDTFEEIFAQRRLDRPEVEISDNLFSVLTGGATDDRVAASDESVPFEVQQVVEAAYGETVQKLGLRPWLRFVRSATFVRPEMRLKVNDRTSPPIPVPGPDEVAVTARPAQLRELGIEARPLVDAITGREQAAVPVSATEQLEHAKLLPVPAVSYIAAAFGRAAAPNAYRMLSTAEVERDLATVEARFPILVHATLARYTLGQITRLLRALAREQVSIRNLRRILSILLAFDAASGEDLDRMFLDDPLPGVDVSVAPPWATSVDSRMLSFVRSRMRDRVCFDGGIYMGGGIPARAHETDEAFEQVIDQLLASTSRQEAERPLHKIRAGVWNALGADADSRPILVTATRSRLALRRSIEAELPAVPVLARTELVPGADIQYLEAVTPVG